jgi:glutamate--cysteine ligase
MVGDKLCGGFLRTHQEKSPIDSLNSPGAVYKRLCISDLRVDSTKCPQENVYGWVAKIGMLSIAKEYVGTKL